MSKEEFKNIPGIDVLLDHPVILSHLNAFGPDLTKYVLRSIIKKIRISVVNGNSVPDIETIISLISDSIHDLTDNSLKKVINATGIVIHTNLGRAPLGKEIFEEILPVITGYTNLEIDLKTGKRGKRGDHIRQLIGVLTGAENALVVNNNAAAVSLVLRTFAEKKEVIVSRGELIEIGGSFRLPDIMKSSGVKLVEIGTTNRTSIQDYENAVTKNSRIILKAYRSNYSITGFTEEANLNEIAEVCQKYRLLFLYDIGSGNFGLTNSPHFEKEPSISQGIKSNVDLITFSCDKLIGGPQAGIIAGKNEYINKLSKTPLMRTYRVDKITLALLTSILKSIVQNNNIENKIPLFYILNRKASDLELLAIKLKSEFKERGIESNVTDSDGFCGGGTLPDYKIKSYAVQLLNPDKDKKFAQKIYNGLLKSETPVLGILRRGDIYFDVLTLFEEEIPVVADLVKKVYE